MLFSSGNLVLGPCPKVNEPPRPRAPGRRCLRDGPSSLQPRYRTSLQLNRLCAKIESRKTSSDEGHPRQIFRPPRRGCRSMHEAARRAARFPRSAIPKESKSGASGAPALSNPPAARLAVQGIVQGWPWFCRAFGCGGSPRSRQPRKRFLLGGCPRQTRFRPALAASLAVYPREVRSQGFPKCPRSPSLPSSSERCLYPCGFQDDGCSSAHRHYSSS